MSPFVPYIFHDQCDVRRQKHSAALREKRQDYRQIVIHKVPIATLTARNAELPYQQQLKQDLQDIYSICAASEIDPLLLCWR